MWSNWQAASLHNSANINPSSKAVIEFDKLARLLSVICVRAGEVVVSNSTYRRDAAVTSLHQIEPASAKP